MERYILPYASMDAEGSLTMDCLGPFNGIEEARKQQKIIMDDFENENSTLANELIREEIGGFQRIAYRNHLTEIQSRIITLQPCFTELSSTSYTYYNQHIHQ